MNDIFISYKVHNRAKAIEYYRELKALHYKVWFDQFVPRGANWKQVISEQISNSRIVLCLLSEKCLRDDWVVYQIQLAKSLQKKMVFITLDETNWQLYEDYTFEESYLSLQEALSLECFQAEILDEKIEDTSSEKDEESLKGHPLEDRVEAIEPQPKSPKRWIVPTCALTLLGIYTILVFILGLHIFRISLDRSYGYILLGILILSGLSFIHKRYIFLLQSVGAIALLGVTIYVMPKYFISGVAVNGFIFLAFYILVNALCYSKKKPWIAIPIALLCMILFLALDFAVIVFFDFMVNYSMSWFSFIPLLTFMLYLYWGNRNEYV